MSTTVQDLSVLERMAHYRLLPVVVMDDVSGATALGDALVAGGLPIAEVTFRTNAAAEAIQVLAARGDILVGAGTVLTPAQVDIAVGAGARFIVSPGLSRAVVERCVEHGITPVPGVVTATEIQSAMTMGLSTVKFFPAATSGGAAAIAAFAGPFGGMKFVPTGGITPTNLSEYLRLATVLAVGGSWMVPGDALASLDVARLTKLVAEAVALASSIRPLGPP